MEDYFWDTQPPSIAPNGVPSNGPLLLNATQQQLSKETLTSMSLSTIVCMVMAIFLDAVTVRYELISKELLLPLRCVWDPTPVSPQDPPKVPPQQAPPVIIGFILQAMQWNEGVLH